MAVSLPPILTALPELAAFARPVVELRVDEAGPPPSALATKIGGPFPWPSNAPWPSTDLPQLLFGFDPSTPRNRTLVPVLQVLREDVPELPFPESTDVLQLLWSPCWHEGPDGVEQVFALRWWNAAQLVEGRNPPPENPERDWIPPPRRLTRHLRWGLPDRRLVPPRLVEQAEAWLRLQGDEEDDYDAIEAVDGIRVGMPGWVPQLWSLAPGDAVGCHLFTVSDDAWPGLALSRGGGQLHVFENDGRGAFIRDDSATK